MKPQDPVVMRGTRMTCEATAGHVVTVEAIRPDRVDCKLIDGRIVPVNFGSIERAIDGSADPDKM